MIQPISDGGPAFATTATATSITRRDDGSSMLTNYGSSAGMSLRDYFAAAALPVAWKAYESFAAAGDNPNQEIAQAAYQIADAMLKARETK